MLLSVNNISKEFVTGPVLSGVSFGVERRQKVALTGANGSGKTTLLKIITGKLEPDAGIITWEKDSEYGYLSQEGTFSGGGTIFEEMLKCRSELVRMESELESLEKEMETSSDVASVCERYEKLRTEFDLKGGYTFRSEIVGVLKGLGFSEEDFNRKADTLSGGQKTRAALGAILVKKPDLIILDEPTNHLDMTAIRWLENYLLNYKGAVMIVSHDRYFLDKIADKVIEVENKKVTSFIGNYSAYAAKKEQLRATLWNAYLKQQQEIKHQEEVITKLKSFNREKSIKRAESREKMLAKIDVLDKPIDIDDRMKISLKPNCESGNDVLEVTGLTKSFGNEHLFSGLDFSIKKGEHVAIIGDNGTGKTTILKILNGVERMDAGEIELGTRVHIGYYDQEHHVLHDEKTLFDEISDDYPSLNNTEIRNTLAAFLFTGDDVFKRIGDLSGGEKGRVSLAKLMLSDANFLILDEPTNHLDITSKEILESAVSGYEGTVLYVSHDRYFINKTATRILDLTHGRLVNYIGNYDYYLEHVDEQNARLFGEGVSSVASPAAAGKDLVTDTSYKYQGMAATTSSPTTAASTVSSAPSGGAQDWKAQKEAQAKKRKLEAALKKCEDEIAKLEQRDSEINEALADPSIGTDLAKLRKLSDEQTEISEKLAALYDEWESISSDMD
jgi:ATP-binding cassette subfamily F protein 3